MQDFTPEDLILYLYGETDPTMTARLNEALETNWALREKLSVLKISMERLSGSEPLSPSASTLEALMAYAKDKTKIPQ